MRALQKVYEKEELGYKLMLVQRFLNPCLFFINTHFHKVFEDSLDGQMFTERK